MNIIFFIFSPLHTLSHWPTIQINAHYKAFKMCAPFSRARAQHGIDKCSLLLHLPRWHAVMWRDRRAMVAFTLTAFIDGVNQFAKWLTRRRLAAPPARAPFINSLHIYMGVRVCVCVAFKSSNRSVGKSAASGTASSSPRRSAPAMQILLLICVVVVVVIIIML